MKTKSPEFEFYLKTDLSKYEGKYVAIVESKVVASGSNAKDVLNEAMQKHPGIVPTLAKVPKAEAMILLFKW